jgi:transcriptional regulator with XRE-family HTH domain
MSFGKRIKRLREDKGVRQEDVGKMFNVSKSAVSQWENDIRTPDMDIIIKLADYFDVSTDFLLGRTDDPSPHPKPETIAAHRTDDPMSELPEEARRSVEEFIDYIYKKYGKKKE